MSAFPYTIAALVLTGAACTAGLATTEKAEPSEALTCELRLSETDRHVTIAAHAEAREAVSGIYELSIEQRSSAGRSTIRQGGEFDLKAGEGTTLGEASFSGRARDFQAELTIQALGERKTCRSAQL